jgi:uncharacterized protein YuzE
MGKKHVSISYLADIDTLFIHFESKAGYYDALPDDDRVQARYDENGRVIGLMVEGLRDVQGWLDVELADATGDHPGAGHTEADGRLPVTLAKLEDGIRSNLTE